MGVEEELLLVDADTGEARAVAAAALRYASQLELDGAADDVDAPHPPGGTLTAELQQEQIETDTRPQLRLVDLAEELRSWRRRADQVAAAAGARVAALATSPLPVHPQITGTPRYRSMVEHFGLTSVEQLICGLHVHVSVDSAEEAVAVLDRVRTWLPVLLALSANSPYWQGQNTGYASFRSQAMLRWPSAGPTDVLGSAEAYRQLLDDMIGSGVILDPGMVYFDARVSQRYPTVEIRIADVCLRVDDTVLIAALSRALVETAAREWRSGRQPEPVRSQLVRMAAWRAGRSSIDAELLDPRTSQPRPAKEVIADLLDHVRPALHEAGDETWVEAAVARVLEHGTGAHRQRAVFERSGSLVDVVRDAVEQTQS
ncbi:carboxylate-amine ligase [Microlunatus panaciterrae]|nr:glutamate--cysteine ligase [Microlunatus panaciterrae]